jgi:hypothetical protein
MTLAEITSPSEALGKFSTGFRNILFVKSCYRYETGATVVGRLWSTLQMKGASILEICRKIRNNIRPFTVSAEIMGRNILVIT